MAFSTSNVQRASMGNLKCLVGQFSSSAADAHGTIAVEGGMVWFASFTTQDASAPAPTIQWDVPYSVSTSGATTTLTLYSNGKVTTGRFIIIYS